jgi:pimeloyl-ACP methyl ester carboxylesterase
VPGTKVFYEARGHGSAPPPQRPGYDELADDLDRIARETAATQAFGVSLGAHTVLRLLTRTPDRFAKAVLFLPAALDTSPVRREGLRDALAAGDEEAVLGWLRGEAPADAEAYVRARTSYLLSSPGLLSLLDHLTEPPVPDRALLAAVATDVLVIAQEGDPVHPAGVARELAALLPKAELAIFPSVGVLWHSRREFRALVLGHLGDAQSG